MDSKMQDTLILRQNWSRFKIVQENINWVLEIRSVESMHVRKNARI